MKRIFILPILFIPVKIKNYENILVYFNNGGGCLVYRHYCVCGVQRRGRHQRNAGAFGEKAKR